MLDRPCLLVIVGATATGKTALAIALAQQLEIPILSADSRQVYQHFDIGTAKPSPAERGGVPHYLLDLVAPDHNFTLAEYQSHAQRLIGHFHDRGISPLLVGGTGQYIKAIVDGWQIPQVPPQIALRQELSQLGQSYCYQLLQNLDAPACCKIHPHDHHRTLRALEVFYVTGKPLSQLQTHTPPPYPILQIGIRSPEPKEHQQIIHDRLQAMLDQGWLAEIRWIQTNYGKNLPLLRTIGYAEMTDFLEGKSTITQAINQATTSTYQFAKRQRTWFASDPRIHWIERSTELGELLNLIHDGKNWQVHPRNDTTHHAP